MVEANAPAPSDSGIVAELSRAWVERLADELTEAGRPLEGGWPGTLSEARRLLATRLSAAAAITRPQFEHLVKAIYDGARSQWLVVAKRSGPLR